MENRYERIQRLQKKSKFRSIAELERACGFKQRTLVEWADHRPAADKVFIVAELLNVSPEYIMNGYEDSSLPAFTPQALQFALWSGENQVTPEQMDEILNFGKYIVERDSKK